MSNAGSPALERQARLGVRGSSRWIIGLYGLHSLISLVYEIIGLRLLAAQFGRTLAAMGLVLAVYMAGMALGAACIATWSRSRPLRVRRAFVGAQLVLGLGGASLPQLMSWMDQLILTHVPLTGSLTLQSLRLGLSAGLLLALATVTGHVSDGCTGRDSSGRGLAP